MLRCNPMKKIISLLMVLAVIFLTSSCGKNDEKNIYFPIENSVRSLDPQIVSDDAGRMIALNIFDCLVKIDENGDIIPGAAESWIVSSDGLTYTFNISEKSSWYLTDTAKSALEGKLPENMNLSVTANDFVFALQRALDPATNAPESELLSGIKGASDVLSGSKSSDTIGVKAVSEKVLQIDLASPDDSFLQILARPICAPCNEIFFNATGGRYGVEMKYMMSNGPFFLTRKTDDSYIRISKSDEYKGEYSPKVSAVYFYINNDSSLIPGKIADGTYEGGFVSTNECEIFGNKFNQITYTSAIKCLIFNCSEGSDTANENIRKAIVSATNPETLSELFGTDTPTDFYPPSISNLMADTVLDSSLPYDIDRAHSFLMTAYKELDITDISLKCACTSDDEETLRHIMQDWQEALGTSCGITVQVLSSSDLRSAVKNGEYDMAIYTISNTLPGKYSCFSRFMTDDNRNALCLSNENYDELCAKIESANGNDAREFIISAKKMLYDSGMLLPVALVEESLVTSKSLTGVYFYGDRAMTYFYEAKL